MLRLVGIVVSIGLADSLNPSTLAPALYLSAGPRARENVAQFTVGVFVVYLFGGALIAVGPGELILALVPKPDQETRHVLEVVAGLVLFAVAGMLWLHRGRLSAKQLPQVDPESRASWMMGATIMALELPTAFPYFTALAAIMGSGLGLPRQIILIVLFNVCFVLPLVGIVVVLEVMGDRARLILARGAMLMQRNWPVLLAGVALIAGAITITLGLTDTVRVADRLLHRVS